ncbi:hypothetical protein QTP88_021496 [Uroleucon formosanum]
MFGGVGDGGGAVIPPYGVPAADGIGGAYYRRPLLWRSSRWSADNARHCLSTSVFSHSNGASSEVVSRSAPRRRSSVRISPRGLGFRSSRPTVNRWFYRVNNVIIAMSLYCRAKALSHIRATGVLGRYLAPGVTLAMSSNRHFCTKLFVNGVVSQDCWTSVEM